MKELIRKKFFYLIFFMIVYIFGINNYLNGYICSGKLSFFIVSILFWVLAYFLCKDKKKEYNLPVVVKWLLFFMMPIAAFYMSEIIWMPEPFSIEITKVIVNYLILLGIELGIFVISRSVTIAGISILGLEYIYGLVNYYLMRFKGNPLTPSEFAAAGTALQVIGNYEFTIDDRIVAATLLLMFLCCIYKYLPYKKKEWNTKQTVKQVVLGSIWFFLFFQVLINVEWKEIMTLKIDAWNRQKTYYANGSVFAFLLEGQTMITEEPEGYSVKTAEDILTENTVQSEGEGTSEKPSVIVIMNESFTDFDILGELETEEYLTNFYNIEDYIVRGNTYVSIMGGGTANSEYEFLTGNSLANFETTIYPYQIYNMKNIYSLPKAFAEHGYKTIAMHPAEAKNWNRTSVYNAIGFDDFISIEDMEDVEKIRNYASDEYNYRKIIEAYESSEEPVFIFDITMQNHGGYSDIENLGDIELLEVAQHLKEYPEMTTYLTLMRESDKAFAELLAYFSEKEEPVIICMFGDHLPSFIRSQYFDLFGLSDDVLEQKQKWFCTPYIIWSNFEMEESNQKKDTSLNYLGASLLELADIYTPYSSFLLNMEKELPILNILGYQTTDGAWHHIHEENEWVNQYRILQHYVMFDKKK